MRSYDEMFIDGRWTAPESNERIEVLSASTEEVVGRVPGGSPADVHRAVLAARCAFEPWAATPYDIRVKYVQRIGEHLQARKAELAELIATEVGMPRPLSQMVQVGMPVTTCASIPALVESLTIEEVIGNSLLVREPVGVVGCITPWNYPLHQVIAKVAPALATGCTVVVKPAEPAPLSIFVLAEIIQEIGLPDGVFNVVSGLGPVAGEALASHPEVDMVSFTGSTRAGRRVAALAAATVKRVTLELGGKSASVILDDADLPRAVTDTVSKAFLNSGQTCSALTRMLVPSGVLPQAEALACKAAGMQRLVDPLGTKAGLGPLVSATQRDRVRRHIRAGLDEGARLVAGGPEQPDGFERGYYVQPTIFSDVTPSMTIAQEEIFGPVLSILPYDDEDDAVRIANDTEYGLSGAVWSGDADRAMRVARRLRTGQVDVNGGRYNPLAPFGGYKQSGNGRELGRHGMAEFTELKALQT